METKIEPGLLYVVATPIGNLKDMTYRAVEVLSSADRVAAEDTRHSARLFNQYQISTPLTALHEHNERQMAQRIIDKIKAGETWALISDAGTPVVSDPGYYLIKMAQEQGVSVVPVPGPNAAIVALSASGMPSDRFVFEGFLPAKSAARLKHLQSLGRETRTMIFYESPHRIIKSLEDMQTVFGAQRRAVLARELTKTFETIRQDTLQALLAWIKADTQQQKGEMVVIVAGETAAGERGEAMNAEAVLQILLSELPTKQAAHLAAKITGAKKNQLYQKALELKKG
jgi:16S rRNA (cytidine1402-2'-O)-methyltransferase